MFKFLSILGLIDNKTLAEVLKNVKLSYFDSKSCEEAFEEFAASTQMCVSDLEAGKDTCQGDSGGGIYVNETSSGSARSTSMIMVGIVSFGDECGNLVPGYSFFLLSNFIY